ncbi:hypothetical protein K435DRAFT_814352 [Dendrothele bispora CBS 962.96]|uniref:Uncharacterized protein n=1 Tax=Dendrothele bispora (strain CBS 962.96) TaxID=1314807 RepID=A0A4S8KJ02_DENBC|nr:hypothetical protein K435DRAFT_814352 [Dendrothele bispora CBS 962.96]
MALPFIITNAVATGTIGWKAWCHHKDIKQNLDLSGNSISRVQKVLLLLVESGVVYCALWALYPILIILIAALENSKDDPGFNGNLDSKGNGLTLSQSIRFASVAETLDEHVSGSDTMTPGGGSSGSKVP